MSQTNDGGPAFPHLDLYAGAGNSQPTPTQYNGMSLRDYFAGQALAGYLANAKAESRVAVVAEWAYDYADAMLAERQKERE